MPNFDAIVQFVGELIRQLSNPTFWALLITISIFVYIFIRSNFRNRLIEKDEQIKTKDAHIEMLKTGSQELANKVEILEQHVKRVDERVKEIKFSIESGAEVPVGEMISSVSSDTGDLVSEANEISNDLTAFWSFTNANLVSEDWSSVAKLAASNWSTKEKVEEKEDEEGDK